MADYSVNQSLLNLDRHHKKETCCNLTCIGLVFLILFVFLITLVICLVAATLATFFAFFPQLSQKQIDSSQLSVVGLDVQIDGANSSLILIQKLVFSNTGSFPATLSPMKALASYNNKNFGFLYLPAVMLDPSGVTNVTARTVLTVTDPTVFHEYNAQLLLGNKVIMRLTGSVNIDTKVGVSLSTVLNFDKDVPVQGAVLQNLTISDLEPITGTESTLVSTGYVSFINPGYISFSLSSLTFNVRTPSGVLLGQSVLHAFNLTSGENRLSFTTYLNKTGIESDVYAFISNWLSGESQTLIMQGPLPSKDLPSWVFNLITNQSVTVLGSTSPLIVKSWINGTSMVGLPPYVYQTSYNPSMLTATQSNLNFSVILQEPIGTEGCAGSVQFPFITYNPPFIVPPKGYNTLFLPTHFPSDQFACGLQRTQAAFCLPANVGLPLKISVNIIGTMNLLLDQFSCSVFYRQENVPLDFLIPNWKKTNCDALPYLICYAPEGVMCNFP